MTAFIIGIVGSMHCIGMCGPIALSLPYQGTSRWQTGANVLLYNFGRVFTYGLLGTIPGLIGYGFALGGHQKTLAIMLGSLLILSAFFAFNIEHRTWSTHFIKRSAELVQKKLSVLLKTEGRKTFFGIGLINGFLPCGLVYLAIAGAVLEGSTIKATLYMMMFGLGTIPLMMGIAFAGNFISLNFRNNVKKMIPFFMAGLGILFILRGINVQLPFDLQLWLESGAPVMCH